MIIIQQGSSDLGNLNSLMAKCSETEISLNTDIISEDIIKVENYTKEAVNKQDKRNMEGTIKYLKKLKNRVDEDGKYQFTWMLDNYKIRAYPFDLKHFDAYKIQATDYIELEKSTIVKVDYRTVFEIIAFEMMYRDLEFSMQDVEKKLEHVGIASVVDAKEITKIWGEDSPLDLSKVFRISDSPYASQDGKLCWDYFGTTAESDECAFTSGKYQDCVGRSVDVAIALITKGILERFNEFKLEFKICALTEDGFYFMIENPGSVNIYNIFESVVVRAFGRRFEVKPNIIVF